MFGKHFQSKLTIVIPEGIEPRLKPSIKDYIRGYYRFRGLPLPKMTDGVEQGVLHPNNTVELLYLAVNYDTWWLITEWVNSTVAEALTEAEKVRAYTDRIHVTKVLYTEVIRGTRYIALLSSPYETKDYVREFTENMWGTHIPQLTQQPKPEPEPVEEERKRLPRKFPNLPPAPKPFIPPKLLKEKN